MRIPKLAAMITATAITASAFTCSASACIGGPPRIVCTIGGDGCITTTEVVIGYSSSEENIPSARLPICSINPEAEETLITPNVDFNDSSASEEQVIADAEETLVKSAAASSSVIYYDIDRLKKDYSITAAGSDGSAVEIMREITNNLYELAEETDNGNVETILNKAAERFHAIYYFLEAIDDVDVPLLMVYPPKAEPTCTVCYDEDGCHFVESQISIEEQIREEYLKSLALGHVIKLLANEKLTTSPNRAWVLYHISDMILESAELIEPEKIENALLEEDDISDIERGYPRI